MSRDQHGTPHRLREAYEKKLLHNGFSHDGAQQVAVAQLEKQLQQIVSKAPARGDLGLYLHGPVGRGKTMLMDLFVSSLPAGVAYRVHHYHFMSELHQALNKLQGQKDPLALAAKQIAERCQVLCLDEFFVSDIGDAMLLGPLIQRLFDSKVRIITTSNCAPEELYADGHHRDRLQPAIAAIRERMSVHQMGAGEDHRGKLPVVGQSGSYFVNDTSTFKTIFSGDETDTRPLTILGRTINTVMRQQRSVWFQFDQLCRSHRSQLDYIELAKQFDLVMVSGVPPLAGRAAEQIKARGTEDGVIGGGTTGLRKILLGTDDDAARRFMSLVDELYDQRVRLMVSAEVPLDQLYQGDTLQMEFRRTRSRLIEMGQPRYSQPKYASSER